MSLKNTAILLISTEDKKGIIYHITNYILSINGNVLDLEQYVNKNANMFFMRVEWDISTMNISREELSSHFEKNIANELKLDWKLYFSNDTPSMALFVSKQAHCLFDILGRIKSGEWEVKIPVVISNHDTWKNEVESSGIEFHYIDINKNNKEQSEKKQIDILNSHNIDFIVLARYMQILSPKMTKYFTNNIINIHHSFLPAFPGAKPYHKAFDRGVKVIGATSHYVTNELDEGPIIEQDVTKVSHNDTVNDLVRKGRDIEKLVLSKAISKHIERKVLVHENKTVVFS